MEKINLLITLEQAEIIADALFSYKCEVKSRMEQAGVISDKEIAAENNIIHEIENNLLPVLETLENKVDYKIIPRRDCSLLPDQGYQELKISESKK